MANLVKIAHTFINLDRVLRVEDLFATTGQDKVVVHFDVAQVAEFSGAQADDLRTWLNSQAVNLHQATDLDAEG